MLTLMGIVGGLFLCIGYTEERSDIYVERKIEAKEAFKPKEKQKQQQPKALKEKSKQAEIKKKETEKGKDSGKTQHIKQKKK